MITTIVFDLGNVLLSFRPEEFFKNHGYQEPLRNLIINDIFKSEEWILLDNGDITTGEAISRLSTKSSLNYEEISSVFDLRTQIIFPLERNVKMLPGLKKRGFKLYFLSNFPDDIFDEVFSQYPFFESFDGGIISARVNASKPGEKIFRILIEKYALNVSECLFIDDSEANVSAAKKIGMDSLHLTDSYNLENLLKSKLMI